MNEQDEAVRRRNRASVRWLAALAFCMFLLGFAMVPLYDLICEAAGIQAAGQVQRVPVAEPGVPAQTDRTLVVKFDAIVHPDLPWDFTPVQARMEVHPGMLYEASYRVRNRSDASVTGQAIPSVTPWQATPYFSKLECFCFTQQTLAGRESVVMPLKFMVSTALPSEIGSLTLSYSFMQRPRSTQGTELQTEMAGPAGPITVQRESVSVLAPSLAQSASSTASTYSPMRI